MALLKPEYFASTTQPATKRVEPTQIHPKTIAAIGGAPLLAVCTPMTFNTSTRKWEVWATGGANGTGIIRGFIWPTAVQSDATDDVLGNLMLAGEIHFDDIVVTGGTLAQLKTAVQDGNPSLRELGIDVVGLAEVH